MIPRSFINLYLMALCLVCSGMSVRSAAPVLLTQNLHVFVSAQRQVLQADSTSSAHSDSTDVTGDSSASTGLNVGPGSVSFGVGAGVSSRTPYLTFAVGLASVNIPDLHNANQALNTLQISYGGVQNVAIQKSSDVRRANFDRVYAEYYSSKLLQAADTTLNQLHGWRIGFHLSSGYSFMRDTLTPSFSLFHTGGLVWSSNTFDVARPPLSGVNTDDAAALASAEHSYFGTHTGFGLRYDLNSSVAVQVEAERTMMFQHYSFFGWLGSAFCEAVSQQLLGAFIINRIERKSPHAVVYAATILRTALSFAWYELRKTKQHFPFGGNQPIVSDAVRIGFAFSL